MKYPVIALLAAAALLPGCASEPKMPTISNGEGIVIIVTSSPKAEGKLIINNEAVGTGVSAGVGVGAVTGGLWGLACGPFAVLCVPLGAVAGVVTGGAAGGLVGMSGALSEVNAEKLQARLERTRKSHPMAAEIDENLGARAHKYWPINSPAPAVTVSVEVDPLSLMTTRDEQVRCTVRLNVSAKVSSSDSQKSPYKKTYEYTSSYAPLAVWLDESSDFVDTALTSANQQLAAKIVADLAPH